MTRALFSDDQIALSYRREHLFNTLEQLSLYKFLVDLLLQMNVMDFFEQLSLGLVLYKFFPNPTNVLFLF
jgi:hypothetical protein